jgi:hypothetical protein
MLDRCLDPSCLGLYDVSLANRRQGSFDEVLRREIMGKGLLRRRIIHWNSVMVSWQTKDRFGNDCTKILLLKMNIEFLCTVGVDEFKF